MTETQQTAIPESAANPTSNDILDKAKDRFRNVIVIGVTDDGKLDIATTMPQYPTLHYFLNKTVFELNVHEMNARKDTP